MRSVQVRARTEGFCLFFAWAESLSSGTAALVFLKGAGRKRGVTGASLLSGKAVSAETGAGYDGWSGGHISQLQRPVWQQERAQPASAGPGPQLRDGRAAPASCATTKMAKAMILVLRFLMERPCCLTLKNAGPPKKAKN